MYFDINKYAGKYAMHCKTEEEAKSFCDYLHSIGRKWCDCQTYKSTIYYACYREQTAYNFNIGKYWTVEGYKQQGYTILEWEDFMKHTFTKEDLKTGDIIMQRNGLIGIVNCELGMATTRCGWVDMDGYSGFLESMYGRNEFDIVAVRRPKYKKDCQFSAFDDDMGTLIYERQEVEEMTLEQVCKLLGKEIKIVK